ncbi:hypothetical protein N3K66_006214 [Trichothecium roseum]|uniref:Uncharacterized protein n=1 Tax=Trichothecium roseum TaxID=47278 RepID=A0ACC0V011_9HYPO|nr:hypothetical protein N3K66_006214 [Trichothecium roseum]
MSVQVPFTLAAEPNTDLWKKPPAHDVSTAPKKSHSKGLLSKFVSATATFSSTYTTLYDQAGLGLTLTSPSADAPKWIKTGVEFYNNVPQYSVVATDNWSDWSIGALPAQFNSGDVASGKQEVTFRIQKEDGSLWFYLQDGEGLSVPLRETTWVYGLGDDWEVDVAALVARPNTEVKGNLEANFTKFDVEWA